MKRLLKNVFAALRKSNDAKPAARAERPTPTPGLGVRSQVKAGSETVTLNFT
jgi:hypothetical protein